MDNSNQNERIKLMASYDTFKLIVRFSIPTIVGMFASGLYTTISGVFVGRIPGADGKLGLAAINATMPIISILFAITMVAGAGAGTLISLKLGSNDTKGAYRALGNGISMGVIASAVLALVIYLFLDPILMLSGTSSEVLPWARSYIEIILLGAVINTLSYCLNRFILSQGYVTMTLVTMLLNILVNIICTPLFIFVFNWGIAGAAWGTTFGQLATAVWCYKYLRGNKPPLTLRYKDLIPDLITMKEIAVIGFAPAVLQVCLSFSQAVTNNMLRFYGGDSSMTVMGVVGTLSNALIMPVTGINQGVKSIISYNYGACLFARLKKILVQSIMLSVALIAVLWVFVILFSSQTVTMFAENAQDIMQEGTFAIRAFLMFLPLAGIQIIGSNYFQAIGKMLPATLLIMSRQVLIFLPSLLILTAFWGVNGVYLSGSVSDLLSSLLTAFFVYAEIKRLNKISCNKRHSR